MTLRLMTLRSSHVLRRLVRQFGLLLLLVLLGAIAGAGYAKVKKPTYSAQAYVIAIGEPGESITALNFAQAYGRIAAKGPVAERAAAALGSASSGLKRVTASTSPDAPVIEITATGSGAKRTADVANAVAKALADYGSARRADTRVNLAVLATASAPTKPSSPKPPLELAVGAAGGLLIGGLAVLAGVGRASARESGEEPVDEPVNLRVNVPAAIAGNVEKAGEVEPGAAPRNVPQIDDTQVIPLVAITGSFNESAAPDYTRDGIASYSEAAAPAYPTVLIETVNGGGNAARGGPVAGGTAMSGPPATGPTTGGLTTAEGPTSARKATDRTLARSVARGVARAVARGIAGPEQR